MRARHAGDVRIRAGTWGSRFGVLFHKIQPAEDPTLIAYRAMLDVPRELVCELATLLRAERRARGTGKGTRLLSCFRQALLVLVWLRTKGSRSSVPGSG